MKMYDKNLLYLYIIVLLCIKYIYSISRLLFSLLRAINNHVCHARVYAIPAKLFAVFVYWKFTFFVAESGLLLLENKPDTSYRILIALGYVLSKIIHIIYVKKD